MLLLFSFLASVLLLVYFCFSIHRQGIQGDKWKKKIRKRKCKRHCRKVSSGGGGGGEVGGKREASEGEVVAIMAKKLFLV